MTRIRGKALLCALALLSLGACGRFQYEEHERDAGVDGQIDGDVDASDMDAGDARIDFDMTFVDMTMADASMDLGMPIDLGDDAGTMLDAGGDMGTVTTSAIHVMPVSGLTTTEGGSSATFTVVLDSAPTGNVLVPLDSSNTTEGTVAPAALTFTTFNWNVPQTVTVTGVNDMRADGPQSYLIHVGPSTSLDASYDGLVGSDVSVINIDEDEASVIVSPTTGLTTSEVGAIATFNVSLSSQPIANVTITLSSSDVSEGSVLPASLTFTSFDWNLQQTVTVTGADDDEDDGDVAYVIVTSAAVSSDPTYNSMLVNDVNVTNTDNDASGILVTPTSGLVTNEAGGVAMFTVVLQSQPSSDVVVAVASNDASEGNALPASLTFTSMNWSMPQTVTVSGVDDLAADGNVAYTIVTSAATSADLAYNGINPSDVSITNDDNDAPNISVSPTGGLVTTEIGGSATISIVLATLPLADVTISLMSSNTNEGIVLPASVTFTVLNWFTPQLITVTGVDDAIDDGDVAYTIVTGNAVSADPGYSGRAVSDVSVINTDDDSASITVTPTSGLVTSEAGATANFTVVLGTQPTADVTIALSSDDASEGTAAPASLIFTSMNWFTPQMVTVTGVNDVIVDGSVAYSIVTATAASADTQYNARAVADVSVTNTDNDAGSVTVMPTSGLTTTESGGTAMFAVVLDLEPGANVVINFASSDLTEGTVSPASLTFTPMDWSTPQSVIVTGVDDSQGDNDVIYTVVSSATSSLSAGYNGLPVADVTVTNADDEPVQQAYVKSSFPRTILYFGSSVSISSDGNTIAVSAHNDSSSATGINGNEMDASVGSAGAVHIFTRSGSTWTWQAYIKASNTGTQDQFGSSVTLSADGNTLAVGANGEWSNATGVGGNQADNSLFRAGAVYVFTRSGTTWTQQAYVKASNTNASDFFGGAVRLAADGNTMAVGAYAEDSNATGIGGNQADNSATTSGAVYVFTRAGAVWSQQAYVKASNTEAGDLFGLHLNLSGDGNTLAVGAPSESSAATGIEGNQADNTASLAGAVYVFTRSAMVWSQQAYIKASNAGAGDTFGSGLTFSNDGNTLVVGADSEDSSASGINGNQADNSVSNAGAVYVFTRSGVTWTQEAYIKSSNPGVNDSFGRNSATSLSLDGNVLAVGAQGEASSATGVGGNQSDNSMVSAGAVYVFTRSGTTWSQRSYIKASNTNAGDYFGAAVALSSDAHTLIVGANYESSNATGINGDQLNNSNMWQGAAYVFSRIVP